MGLTSHMISPSYLLLPCSIRRPVTCCLHAKPTSHSFISSNNTTNGAVSSLNLINKSISRTNPQNCLTKATTQEHGQSPPRKSSSFLDYIHLYVRPYVLRATVTAVTGTVGRILMENHNLVNSSNWVPISLTAITVLATILLTDGFVSEINNIFDLDIDKINKPQLPLAAGEISKIESWTFVLGSAIVSAVLAFFLKSNAFLLFVLLQLAAGCIYSVPPFYTKRSTYGAILTCASFRGYIYHLLVCAGAATIFGLPFQLSPPVVFLALFSTCLAAALGIMKDLPDIQGDALNNVPTLAAINGPRFAASLGFGLMFLAYVGSTAAGVLCPQLFNGIVMIPAHVAIGSSVAFQAWQLHQNDYNKEASKRFFSFMWNLFNVEYLIFPFI